MKLYSFLILFLLIFSFFSCVSFAETKLFVGVSPSVIDLGELERDTTKLVKFNIVSVSEEPLLVYLEPEEGRLDYLQINYNSLISNYSEQSVVGWIKFINNPVELEPQNENIKTGYETIRGWKEVSFLLEIPENAEPGYHLFRINPVPKAQTETSGRVGTVVVAITSINIIFKIPGNAKRDGTILDVIAGNYKPNNLEIDTYFQNKGTTTITARAIQRIYDENGKFIRELFSATDYLRPKEIKTLTSFLPTTGLSFGNYNVFTKVTYTTDSSIKNSTITLTPEMLVVKPKEEAFPIWIFIVIIIVFAIIIYRWIH